MNQNKKRIADLRALLDELLDDGIIKERGDDTTEPLYLSDARCPQGLMPCDSSSGDCPKEGLRPHIINSNGARCYTKKSIDHTRFMSKKDKTSWVHAIRALVEEVARGQRLLTTINEGNGAPVQGPAPAPAPAPAPEPEPAPAPRPSAASLSVQAEFTELKESEKSVAQIIGSMQRLNRKIKQPTGKRNSKRDREKSKSRFKNEKFVLDKAREDLTKGIENDKKVMESAFERRRADTVEEGDEELIKRSRQIIERKNVILIKIAEAIGSDFSGGFDSDLGSDFSGSDFSGSDFDSDSDW